MEENIEEMCLNNLFLQSKRRNSLARIFTGGKFCGRRKYIVNLEMYISVSFLKIYNYFKQTMNSIACYLVFRNYT